MQIGCLAWAVLAGGAAAADAAGPVVIPAATLAMGCSGGDAQCAADEGRAGGTPVSVPAFLIDRHEVTVSDYRLCVAAGRCTAPLDNRPNLRSSFRNVKPPRQDGAICGSIGFRCVAAPD